MRNKALLFVGLNMLSLSALADISYSCKLNDAERLIEVVYANAGQALPCSVNYTKDGSTQTLWHYENSQGLCESKAAEFAEKQTQWGWTCAGADATEATTETESEPAADE